MGYIQDFNTLVPPSGTPPSGWNKFGSGGVNNFEDPPGGQYSTGLHKDHFWSQTFGHLDTDIQVAPALSFTLYLGWMANDQPGGIATTIAEFLNTAGSGAQANVMSFQGELDGSFSIIDNNGKRIGNTGDPSSTGKTFFGHSGTWYWLQLDVDLLAVGDPPTNLSITATLSIDGVTYLLNVGGVSPQGPGGAAINQVSYIANVPVNFAYTSLLGKQTAATFPNPVTGRLVRISQAVLETAIQPSDGNMRVSQMVLETVIKPSTAKIRVSQMVIELMASKKVPQGGWIIKES